ncbi:CMRF35-like molecule 8 [Pygocentrus nattereri]|uniref:CMRF35-like molecule 8 n=1 Tax=Pygocentrus nattereri TaxID=42514 RepID=UPI001890D1C4|nr:CMRF35-like molecule 8 [Pygocentrus nattereri]
MEQSGCVNIIKDQTKSKSVTSGRFKIYSNTADNFTVLIRELKPQDSAVYRFGVGNEKYKDIELTVQSDSCCGGIKRMKAYLGETATFKCTYPDEFKTNNKRLINLDNRNNVSPIIYTGKRAQKEQKGRFSIFDDRSSNVFSVNISDVTEDDGGLYLCGVWRKKKSVGYHSYFREIQLQVTEKSTVTTTSWTTSAAETSDEEHLNPGSIIIITTVCACVALLLIGGSALIIYYVKRKKRQGSTSSSKTKPKDDKQVPLVVCTYEEIKHTRPASPPTNTSHTDIHSTEDHGLTYATVSFQKNPALSTDATATFSKEESDTLYSTVKYSTGLE